MKVEELLKVLFDDQRVELARPDLSRFTLFYGLVRDLPDEFKNRVVTSCYASFVDSGLLTIFIDEV